MSKAPVEFTAYAITDRDDGGQIVVGHAPNDPTQNGEICKYIRKDIHGERMRSVIAEREDLRKQLEASKRREEQQLEAITVLANQGGTSPTELAQLGVGNVIENPNWKTGDDPATRYSFVSIDLSDLAQMTNNAMHQQATVAKFRQLKDHFVTHQRAVSYLLDELQKGAGANRVGDIRRQLQIMIAREI